MQALVLGLGNVLWADEGFGVRAVEALHAAFAFPDDVSLLDGGTQGLNLLEPVCTARRLLVLDAVDYGLAPGSLKILRDRDVPDWSARKLSAHQTGFNDVLALSAVYGRRPETIVVLGVQPEELADFGGSLRDSVRARVPEVVELAARELAGWGVPGRRRTPAEAFEPLNSPSLAAERYEAGRPSQEAACRIGDPRVLARRAAGG